MSEAEMRVCRACHQYTLQEQCATCHGAVKQPHPARYSPQDRYGRYRRALYAAAGAGEG
jgi:H/ACA ribonucleoprotein complex subunit 3